MSIHSVSIGLQASRADARGVSSAEFLVPLAVEHDEVEATHADGGAWAAGMVFFAVVTYGEFAHVDRSADAGAQSITFEEGVANAFRAAGRFLDRRAPAITTGMRATGLKLRLFVDVRMDQDQMELELPPELLGACGRHGIGIYVISNDIPAAEIMKSR